MLSWEGRKIHDAIPRRGKDSVSPGNPAARIAAWILAALILTLAVFPSEASAGVAPLEISNISLAYIEADPHQIVSSTFRVSNNTDDELRITTALNLPDGWSAITSNPPFSLAPHGESSLFVSFSIPAGNPAGRYTVEATISAGGVKDMQARASVDVEVLPLAGIVLIPPVGDTMTFAGERFSQTFTAVNQSNSATRIIIEFKSNLDWDISYGPIAFTLAPGESQPVVVEISAPKDIAREERLNITLNARSLDLGRGKISARAVGKAVIYPRLLPGELYETMDGTASFILSRNDDNEVAAQMQLDIEGELGEGRYGRFQLTTPFFSDWRDQRFLDEEFFLLEFIDDAVGSVNIGDETIHVTPLTERYYYGRGFDIESFSEPFSFRLFASKRRGGWLPGYLAGTQLEYTAPDDSRIVLTGVAKTDKGSAYSSDISDRESRSMTLSASTSPDADVFLEAEFGTGDYDRGNGSGRKPGDAFRIAVNGDTGPVDFDAELVRAGANFPGYWRGIDLSRAYVGIDIDDGISLWANISENSWSFGAEPNLPHPAYAIRDFGVNFSTGGIGRLSVSHKQDRRRDTNLFSYDDERWLTSFQLTRTFDDFTFTALTAFGRKIDNLTGIDRDIRQHELMLTLHPSGGPVISAGYRRDIEKNGFGISRDNASHFWINADIKINDKTKLTTRYSRATGTGRNPLSWVRAVVEHKLPKNRVINLITQWRKSGTGSDFDTALELTLPLSIPLHWLPKSGRLQGYVFGGDDINEVKRPLQNVVVAVDGIKLATDENGKFVFPALAAGEYELTIDRGTLGFDRVPAIIMPFTFTIERGDTVEVEIPILRSASIHGRVYLLDGPLRVPGETVPDSAPGMQGYPSAMLSLECGDETILWYADSGGRFDFSGLRPGAWTLRLLDGQLPVHHRAIPEYFILDLSPGETAIGIDFIISPIERPMEITPAQSN